MKKRIYTKRSEKITDFFLGVVFSFVFSALSIAPTFFGIFMRSPLYMAHSSIVSIIISLAGFAVTLGMIVYLCLKRLYMGLGLLFGLVGIPLILLGTCLLVFSGASILGPLFKR